MFIKFTQSVVLPISKDCYVVMGVNDINNRQPA